MIRTAIFGGSGYSGRELIRILLRHPQAEIRRIFARSTARKRISEVYPEFRGRIDLGMETFAASGPDDYDLAFLALPHGESMTVAPALLAAGKKVIDLSGDFRLPDPVVYAEWYGRPHLAAASLPGFVYGLPELFADRIRGASAVANPGCYPTAVILGLAPLMTMPGVDTSVLTVNAMSGVSGAGRKADQAYSYCEINGSARAYKIGRHQHAPEIGHYLSSLSGRKTGVVFVPHLVPMERGIYATVCVPNRTGLSVGAVLDRYAEYYAGRRFVRLVSGPPEISSVAGTNYCDIGISHDPENDHFVINSAIDNLIKGAAGQAVQNMNLLFDLKEEEGLQ